MPELSKIIELLLVPLAVALVTQRTRRSYSIALAIVGLVLGLLGLVEPCHSAKNLCGWFSSRRCSH